MEVESKVTRPWGTYEVLLKDRNVKIKRITVHDLHRLSLQTHEHRDEYWFITAGQGIVEVDHHQQEIKVGDQITVMRGEKHRVKALGGNLVFIEVQHGAILDEEDIVRHEDDYGR